MASLDKILQASLAMGTLSKEHTEKTLSSEEEVELGMIIQASDTSADKRREAVECLVLKNIFLVVKTAHRYVRKEFELQDLVGYGILGLYKAAMKYDPHRQNRFASYARHWIKESIMKAIREYSGNPKIPVYLVKNLWKVSRILAQNENIPDDELARRTNLTIENARYLRSLFFKTVQFNNTYSEIDASTPEDIFIQKEREVAILQQLEKLLTPAQYIVITHRYGLCGSQLMTFKEIQKNFKEILNARRINAEAIKVLRQSDALQLLYTEGLDV